MSKQDPLTFKEAVETTPGLEDGYRVALQALGKHSGLAKAADRKLLEGSVDMDACLEYALPDAARWDYAIGYGGQVHFMEVHPANTSNVKEMVAKAKWLREWLAGVPLGGLTQSQPYTWIPSGKFAILRNSPQYRQIAQSGLKIANFLELK